MAAERFSGISTDAQYLLDRILSTQDGVAAEPRGAIEAARV